MGLAWDLWGVYVPCMADMADGMGWDWHGIGMGQKIPPDPSRAEWENKTKNVYYDERKRGLCYMLKLFLNHSL